MEDDVHFRISNGTFEEVKFNPNALLGENPIFLVDVSECKLSWPPKNNAPSRVAKAFLDFINSTYKTNYQSFGNVFISRSYDDKAEELEIQLQTNNL